MTRELVNVSDINQFVYCPRRYWYLHFYDTQGRNYYRTDGTTIHENKASRGGWTQEMYIESESLGLKGKIDVLEESDELVPVERKRGDRYWYNDELQLAGYCLLVAEATGGGVPEGVIYLYESDERERISITEEHRRDVEDVVDRIRTLSVDDVPPLVDNPNKCPSCSTRQYCMPEETAILEPDKAEGTGWEDRV